MRITLLSACLLAVSRIAAAADMPANHPPIDGAEQITPANHSGEVTEAIPVAGYIYLHVKGAEGDEWLAAPAADLKPGARIKWNDGVIAPNFTSKSLNRSFASIRFVETVELAK